jgi:hypothetical protein
MAHLSWYGAVTGILIRAGFTTVGKPAVGYLVTQFRRKKVTVQIFGERTLKITKLGGVYVHKKCTLDHARTVIGGAALSADCD